jgi:protein SCO1/2
MLRRHLILSLFGGGVVGATFGLAACSGGRADNSGVSLARPFSLTDQHGRQVTEKTYFGKPSAVFFGFTYCPEVCPTTLAALTRWMKALGPDADHLNVLYITVDPERDTPKQMALYLSSFDPRITGLSGTPAQIAQVASEYRVYYKKVPLEGGSYTMDHSTAVYLMDRKGELSDVVTYQQEDKKAIEQLRRLIELDRTQGGW